MPWETSQDRHVSKWLELQKTSAVGRGSPLKDVSNDWATAATPSRSTWSACSPFQQGTIAGAPSAVTFHSSTFF